MLITFILRLVSLAGMATGIAHGATDDVTDEVIDSPRVAQVRLADTLGNADAIHAVVGRGKQITFVISSGDKSQRITATTGKHGQVVALTVAAAPAADAELGGLSWLGEELAQATAVTRLTVDEDGAVTITTNDGRRYMAIPGRGSGGNIAVESRWAAEWNAGDRSE